MHTLLAHIFIPIFISSIQIFIPTLSFSCLFLLHASHFTQIPSRVGRLFEKEKSTLCVADTRGRNPAMKNILRTIKIFYREPRHAVVCMMLHIFLSRKCIRKLHTLIFFVSSLLTEHINAYYSTEIISLTAFCFF